MDDTTRIEFSYTTRVELHELLLALLSNKDIKEYGDLVIGDVIDVHITRIETIINGETSQVTNKCIKYE